MDLDGDGLNDVLSGSWPGEIYWFRRQKDGSFAPREPLRDRGGERLNVGSASAAFAADWDDDRDLDLLVGTITGEVHLIPNEGTAREFAWGEPQALIADDQPLQPEHGDASPVAADWDADGDLDLLVGNESGSVVRYENQGSRTAPKLAGARTLVPTSPIDWDGGRPRRPGQWGRLVKICVADWNGDGRLDLILGDFIRDSERGRPKQSNQEREREQAAQQVLEDLRKTWAETFQRYRSLVASSASADPAEKKDREERLNALRKKLQRQKNEIAAAQSTIEYFRPGWQSHGFVWVFLRESDSPRVSSKPSRSGGSANRK